jgi:hypothetical protein
MLTDKEILNIAEPYLKRKGEFGGSDIEVVVLTEEIIKKDYGSIYYYQSKEFILTGNINKALTPGTPFLVEKSTGRVVAFASAMSLENNIKLYENGTMTPSLYSYWYPEEDRFDYK